MEGRSLTLLERNAGVHHLTLPVYKRIPPAGDQNVRLNLWLQGAKPPAAETEVIIDTFDWKRPALDKPGIFRAGQWIVDTPGDFGFSGFGVDRLYWFGVPGDIPVSGDWDGSGGSKVGVYREVPNVGGQWFLDHNGNGQWDGCGVDLCAWFGIPGDQPVVGDWDGSGRVQIGVYREVPGVGGQWFLDYNGNFQWDGIGQDPMFWFGLPQDRPVAGDWDGSGRTKIGVYRAVPGVGGQWFLDYNGNLQWDGIGTDLAFWFGIPGDRPVVGDWDGSGQAKIGVYREVPGLGGQWFLD